VIIDFYEVMSTLALLDSEDSIPVALTLLVVLGQMAFLATVALCLCESDS
jgi:hypothetical protein